MAMMPASGGLEPGDQPEHGGLARARWANDGGSGARIDVERESVDSAHATERLRHPVEEMAVTTPAQARRSEQQPGHRQRQAIINSA